MQQNLLPNFQFVDEKQRTESSWREEIFQQLGIELGTAWPDRFGKAIRSWLIKNDHQPIRTLSLFAGGGGLDIAFHDVGFHSIMMVEIEKKYVTTLKTNAQTGGMLEGSKVICTDIRDFYPPSDLEIDFIIGGPPCQTFSAAGRRAAGVMGTSDPRGTLFEEYVRILKLTKPRGFLFENVYGITGAQQGKAWQEIQDAFKDAGYSIYYRILDAADYGVPQHRERLFIVGLREGEYLFPRPTHGPDAAQNESYYTAQEAVTGIDTRDAKSGLKGIYGHLLENIPPGLNYSFYTEKMGHPNPVFGWRSKFSDFLYKADPDAPVRTLKAQGGQYTGPFSWENRPFTVDEMKRLQTFPDNYTIVGNRQAAIEQIGNSVPPQIGRMLALGILDQVFGVKLPFTMRYLKKNEELKFRQRKRQLTELYTQRAAVAIKELKANSIDKKMWLKDEITEKEIRYISPQFALSHKHLTGSLKLRLHYILNGDEWIIGEGINDRNDEACLYEIIITPSPNDKWVLPTQRVVLHSCSTHNLVFTSLWKAFEEKILEHTGVADLVQLNGYYQYTPRIRCEMVLAPEAKLNVFWKALQLIVRGTAVAKQYNENQLAFLLGIDPSEVLPFLEKLREMGYEARNSNTNPQIQAGAYLIPYTFPTLTPRSVQLHKSLRG